MAIPLYIFFPNNALLETFFRQYNLNEIQEKHKNKRMRESCFFMFRRLQTITGFFMSNT